MILENPFLSLSLFQNVKQASIRNNSNNDNSPGNQLIQEKELIILADSTQISAELLGSFLRGHMKRDSDLMGLEHGDG